MDPAIRSRIDAVIGEGCEIFDQFDETVRVKAFHPFVPADYALVLDTLLAIQNSGRLPRSQGRPSFLELGSATGVITIVADLLGFDAFGIELDGSLVATARKLAERHESRARFAAGSFLPAGYRWKPESGDARMGTIGSGPSAYMELGRALDDFDVVYAYPWDGEAPIMLDLMRRYGNPNAQLLLMDTVAGPRIVRNGRTLVA
jgi:SAM-dependent methyltransferase